MIPARWILPVLLMIFAAGGCQTSSPLLHNGGATGPAVVAFVSSSSTDRTHPHIVASGVPRPNGRIITARHVLEHFPRPHCAPGQDDEKFIYEITTTSSKNGRKGDYASDIGLLRTSCRFDRFDRLVSKVPPFGTHVWISGYPQVVFGARDISDDETEIKPSIVEGVIVKRPADSPEAAVGSVAIEINGIWSDELHGFSGGPCAYRDRDGRWVVFGIAVEGRGDAVLRLLGATTDLHVGPRKALLYVAPIPDKMIDSSPMHEPITADLQAMPEKQISLEQPTNIPSDL